MSWQDVKTSGRKGEGKTGLNCTPYKDSDMRKVSRPSSVGDEVQMLGLRAGSAGRLFGYYADHVFYVLWFDSHHEIVPV